MGRLANVESILEVDRDNGSDVVCIVENGIAMNAPSVFKIIGHNRRGRAASKADLIVHVQWCSKIFAVSFARYQ